LNVGTIVLFVIIAAIVVGVAVVAVKYRQAQRKIDQKLAVQREAERLATIEKRIQVAKQLSVRSEPIASKAYSAPRPAAKKPAPRRRPETLADSSDTYSSSSFGFATYDSGSSYSGSESSGSGYNSSSSSDSGSSSSSDSGSSSCD
jgi:type II secretory pathway pseudopilin PulG